MNITRRDFLKYCGLSAATLGLTPLDLKSLAAVLARPDAPTVLWLHGSSCTGCSVSLLNYISDTGPHDIAEVLTSSINLAFHPTIMALSGEASAAALHQAAESGPYVLVVEGGIPTAFDGHACVVYSYNGHEVTMQEAVQRFAPKAAAILCVGTCSSFGGIPHANPNPTGVVHVRELTGLPTINISGCPANPAWVIWAVVQLILGHPIPLDSVGRPISLYHAHGLIHHSCPRNPALGGEEATSFSDCNHKCLINLGCRGPFTEAKCENCWNGKEGMGHWCIGVNAPCHGCVEPSYPGQQSFYEPYLPDPS